MLPNNYQWVSKAQTGRDLLTLLQHCQSDPDSFRRSSLARRLRFFATPELAPELEAIVLDEGEEAWVRTGCLRALANCGEPAQESVLQFLLDRWFLDSSEHSCHYMYDGGEISRLVVDEPTKNFVLRYLQGLPASYPFHFLQAINEQKQPNTNIAQTFYQELLRLVLERGLAGMSKPQFVRAVTSELDYLESRQFIYRHLFHSDFNEAMVCQIPRLAQYSDFQELKQSHPLIAKKLGVALEKQGLAETYEDLFERPFPAGQLEKAIQGLQVANIELAIQNSGKDDRLTRPNIPRITYSLVQHREGVQRIPELLNQADLNRAFWHKLERMLHEHEPQLARDWLKQRLATPRSDQGQRVLAHLAAEPELRDLELFSQALGHPEPSFRYSALHALETLEQPLSEEQIQRLQAEQDIFVQLRFHAFLWRQGDSKGEEFLLAHQSLDQPLKVRAEALRWLAAVDPTRHFERLRWSLLNDQADFGYDNPPVAEEAAYGLVMIGSAEALVVLLQAALTTRSDTLSDALDQYLQEILARLSGQVDEKAFELGGYAQILPPRNCPQPIPFLYPDCWRGTLGRYPGSV